MVLYKLCVRKQSNEMGKCGMTWKSHELYRCKHAIKDHMHSMFPSKCTSLIVPTYRKRNRRIRLCVSMYNTLPVSGSMTGSR